MAVTRDEPEQRRRRWFKGLLLGSAAVGLPALANRWVARQAGTLAEATWGRSHRYRWGRSEVSFQRSGSGEPLLALHSLGPGQDSHEWRHFAGLVVPGRQLIAPDLPGWGRSASPEWRCTANLYLAFLRDFVADVIGEQAVIIAAGHAAAYAVAIAAEKPSLVRALVLIGPRGIRARPGGTGTPPLGVVERMLNVPVLGTSALNLYTSRASLARHLAEQVYAAPERVDAALVEHHYRAAHQPGAHRALAALLGGDLELPVKDLLPRLERPPLLAWGRHATAPPVEAADLWLHHVPEAELEVFEGSGNLPHVEDAHAFWGWMRARLEL